MSGDIALSRIGIQTRPLEGGAYGTAYVVLLDGKVVASRMHRPSPEEALDLARTALLPSQPPVSFNKNTYTYQRGRPSAAAKAARAARDDDAGVVDEE